MCSGLLGEFALGELFGGLPDVVLDGDRGIALAVGALPPAAAVELQLIAAKSSGVGSFGPSDLDDLDHIRSDRRVGAEFDFGETTDFGNGSQGAVKGKRKGVYRTVRENPRTSKRGLYGAPVLSARISRRKSDFGRSVGVKVGGEAVFGGEIDGRGGLVGVIDAGQPFMDGLESLRGEAQGLSRKSARLRSIMSAATASTS